MTNTVGYYNGNKWPLDIMISELGGVILRLPPGAYVVDNSPQRRKINDPFFDKYTRPYQLTKEISKNGPVPLLAVPRVTSPTQPNAHQHSVRGVTSFTHDASGQRVPNLPPVIQQPNLAVNTPTHKGMSMEEARRLGLVGKPRVVPEDYGVTDTDGRPVDVSKAPPIKYAMESTPRIRQNESLPAELTQMDERIDPREAASRQKLLGGLNQASSKNVESATGFMHEVEANQPPNFASPLGTQPAPAAPASEAAQVAEQADEALPAPNIFASDLVVTESAHPTPATGVPDPLAEAKAKAVAPAPAKAAKQAAAKPATPKTAKPFVCNVDGESFRYRSQLETYAKRHHPDQVAQILEPYPPS